MNQKARTKRIKVLLIQVRSLNIQYTGLIERIATTQQELFILEKEDQAAKHNAPTD